MFRKRVVVIDDSKEICEFLRILLEENGFEVITYLNPQTALSNLKDEYPGVLIVDYLLPTMDGVDVIVKAKKLVPETRVIMLTGKGSEMVAVAAMKAGASDYIKKPIDTNEMLGKVEEYMDEFCNSFIYMNKMYSYPIHLIDVARYELVRSVYSRDIKSIKIACCVFKFSRNDFYVYARKFLRYGPAGMLDRKVFKKVKNKVRVKPGPYIVDPITRGGLKFFIDPDDYVQKKLEMIRRAVTEEKPNISLICKENNLTREAFYQIYRKFNKEGIYSLIPKSKGRPKKYKDEPEDLIEDTMAIGTEE